MRIPFIYSLWVYTSSGKRVERTYRETIDIDARAVDPADFPIGVRLPSAQGPQEYRCLDGELYMPVSWNQWVHDGFVATRATFEQLESALGGTVRGGPRLHDFFPQREILDAGEVKLKGPPKPETIEYGRERREETIERVKAAAAQIVVCDGVVHRRVREPMLVMEKDRPSFRILSDDHPEIAWHLAFRLDEAAEARAMAAETFTTTPAQVHMPDFEVHPAFPAGREIPFAFMSALMELENAATSVLPDLPLPAMAAYCDLKESRHPPSNDQVAQFVSAMALLTELEAVGACPGSTRTVRPCLARIGRIRGLDLSDDDRLALSL